jgi:hypothetical protein
LVPSPIQDEKSLIFHFLGTRFAPPWHNPGSWGVAKEWKCPPRRFFSRGGIRNFALFCLYFWLFWADRRIPDFGKLLWKACGFPNGRQIQGKLERLENLMKVYSAEANAALVWAIF